MNKFDLRKYFEFNVLLEQLSKDKEGHLYRITIDKDFKYNERSYQKITEILNNLKNLKEKIEPFKRTTVIKHPNGTIEEIEDENGENFYFKSFDEVETFVFALFAKDIKFSHGYTDDDLPRKEDK